MTPRDDRPAVAYYWGDDAYSVARAADSLAARLGDGAEPMSRWRVSGGDTTPDVIAERVATSPLFGGGTVVVVADPAPLVASKQLAGAMYALLHAVAPGNGLAFLETLDATGRRPAALEALAAAVGDAGGEVRQFAAPRQGEMSRWILERAAERGIQIAPPAATQLAERVGAFVRENDVDRHRQGELAVMELEKLAVYRLGEAIRPEDVAALVPDAVPGSTWAFLDAVAARRAGEAAALAQRLTEVPGPVLVVHLHRRIRELILVAELRREGADPATILRESKLNPYVARKLLDFAGKWTIDELEGALAGLLELDAAVKHGGGGLGDAGVVLWLAERVAAPQRATQGRYQRG